MHQKLRIFTIVLPALALLASLPIVFTEALRLPQSPLSQLRISDTIWYTDEPSLSWATLTFRANRWIFGKDVPQVLGNCLIVEQYTISGATQQDFSFHVALARPNCRTKGIIIRHQEREYPIALEVRSTQDLWWLFLDRNFQIPEITASGIATIRKLERQAFERQQYEIYTEEQSNLRYISPVPGKKIPVLRNLIPWAARSYRVSTTDGIHHGWDIFAPIWSPVVALSRWKIIRIVDNFSKKDFLRVQEGVRLTPLQQAQNLDIFRWNQVWLQTIKGDIVFYSHLSAIAPGLEIWKWVQASEILGSVWVSWVPVENYLDSHLHFEIQVPQWIWAQSREISSVLSRPYFGKGLSVSKLLETQAILFAPDGIDSTPSKKKR
jgi:murein DD-endopeptidase MepM/ murein hydrolase activator NlpD